MEQNTLLLPPTVIRQRSPKSNDDIVIPNATLDRLPPVQARRVYARFILGRSVGQIARAEKADESNVRKSIQKGLAGLKKYLNYFC